MSDVPQKVAQILLQTEAIQVYKEKPFVFVSGRISPVYIDCRKLLSFADEREYIVTQLAKKAGVPRFLFAGSCSVYGQGTKLDLDEGDPLNPLTAYAQSKIETEKAVSELADETFESKVLLVRVGGTTRR